MGNLIIDTNIIKSIFEHLRLFVSLVVNKYTGIEVHFSKHHDWSFNFIKVYRKNACVLTGTIKNTYAGFLVENDNANAIIFF